MKLSEDIMKQWGSRINKSTWRDLGAAAVNLKSEEKRSAVMTELNRFFFCMFRCGSTLLGLKLTYCLWKKSG